MKLTHYFSLFFIPLGSIVIGYFTITSLDIISAITAVFLLISNIIVFYLYNGVLQTLSEKYQRYILEHSINSYRNELAVISKSQTEIRCVKHDLENHINVIRKFCENKQYADIIKYLNNISNYTSPKDVFSMSDNMDVDSILNYKLSQARTQGLAVNLKTVIPENFSMNIFDLNVILGNLIDNSVTAALESEIKTVDINITYSKGVLFIEVENSYSKSNFNNFKTNKPEKRNHGYGLKSVQNIVDKYEGLFMLTPYSEKITAKIVLYNV
jgi:sensor histidine kinase regulating citrate/malate metabolism